MALLYIDGFDAYGTGTSLVPYEVLAWRYMGYNITTGLNDPRVEGSGRSARTNGSYFYIVTPPMATTDRTMIVGFGFYLTLTGQNGMAIEFFNKGDRGLYAYFRGKRGELDFYRDGGTFLGSTSGARMCRKRWSYVEIKVYVDSSAGTLTVNVDGAECLALTGINTQGTTENYFDRLRLLDVGSNYQHVIDDLYICDGSGSVNNDFLGPSRVVVLRPDDEVSGETDWTTGPTPGQDHSEMVDEVEVDEDSTYVESDTSDEQDLWEYEAPPSSIGTIHGVQLCTDCRLTDAEPFDLKTPAQLGTTYSEGSSMQIESSEYHTLLRVMDTDPDGNPWTSTNLGNTQFGVKVA